MKKKPYGKGKKWRKTGKTWPRNGKHKKSVETVKIRKSLTF